MSDLRERLEAESFGTGTWEEPSYTKAIAVEDVPAVVVEWLRDEADQLRKPGPGRMAEGDAIRRIEANALDVQAKRLADSLTRKEPTGG